MDLKQEKLQEMRADLLQEDYLRSDFDAFYVFTEKEHEEVLEAVKRLRNLYEMYGHEFDLGWIGDGL
jgi:DNA-binding MarR family transcriptional regulator